MFQEKISEEFEKNKKKGEGNSYSNVFNIYKCFVNKAFVKFIKHRDFLILFKEVLEIYLEFEIYRIISFEKKDTNSCIFCKKNVYNKYTEIKNIKNHHKNTECYVYIKGQLINLIDSFCKIHNLKIDISYCLDKIMPNRTMSEEFVTSLITFNI